MAKEATRPCIRSLTVKCPPSNTPSRCLTSDTLSKSEASLHIPQSQADLVYEQEKKQKYVTVEKDTLYRLDRHPGIVRLHWTFHDERSLYFVLELANNGELLKCIKKSGSFSIDSTVYYAAQILSTVEHMHNRGVIHRDLKPEK